MIDDTLYRKQMIQLLRLNVDLQTTITAMGVVLTNSIGEGFEQLVGVERKRLEERSSKVLAAFEAADTAEWTEMLRRLNDRPH